MKLSVSDWKLELETLESEFVPIRGGYKQYISDNLINLNEVQRLELWSEYILIDENKKYFSDLLTEKTYKDLRRDAPNYLRIRQKSKDTPGSNYIKMEGNIIFFKTPSHRIPGVVYDQMVKLVDLDYLIQKYRNVKKPIDIVRMALEGNIEVHCTDPSWKYWGFQYIGTKKDYAVEPEPRYPKIRNPNLKGSVCKHLDNVLFILPFQNGKVFHDLRAQRRL